MGSQRSTFTSSSGIVTQESIVMFSKIFIFAIISVTIRGSLGMDTNDLLDILESRLEVEDDRQELGNSDLEAIRTLKKKIKWIRSCYLGTGSNLAPYYVDSDSLPMKSG